MLLFLFFILVCCAVKCDYVSNNYYIIEMPEAEVPRDYNTPFKVYWNVPTKQCLSRKVVFDNLAKFGIIQNQNDSFEGGRITIMYDPGVFPAIFKTDSGKYRYRNGGVPQQGNLELHLTAFRESINKSIPNPDFSGAGVIDFESWRPIFRQQFGSLTPYIDLSMNIEKRRHWWWPTAWQKMEATKRFEDAARVFMQTTLSIAKQMRPRAIWGYYAFPYCFNMASNNLVENCSTRIKGENDNENYIIEAPDIDVPKAFDTAFKVYWNVPTKQCRSKKIPFDDLLKKYSITYNKNDRFEGEYITILYDGGYTPKILKSDGAKYSLKNGGLPQEGNLDLHLIAFRESVNRLIPDPEFNGVGVIDMENWRPIFRQHWSSLAPVVDLSLSIEKRHYWWWPSKWQKMEATKRFEDAARLFMEKTLTTAKQMRPKAIWGYYGYPYCYNMMSNNMVEHCSKNVKDENDRLYWLWAESTALYPSIYFYSSLSTFEIKKLISGRLTEANRVKLDGTLVIPYFALTYQGKGRFLSEEEVDAVFETLQNQQASSLIVWGSSNDVNTVEKCNQLYKYVDSTFGPIAKKYIQKITKIQEQINSENEEHYFENTLNDNVYAPIVTTEIPKKILNKSQGSESTFINSIDNVLHTTKKYEVSDNETVNKSSNKNTNSSDNISSEKHLLLSNNDHRAIILPITEHTTKEKMSQNSPTNNSSNEFIILSQNVSNPVNSSVDISITEHNADYALTKNQEQQLKKYFYETDGSESDFKSNESDIWSVISYDTSSDQEETPEIIKNEKYVGNSENLIQEFIEIDNSSTVNTKDTRSILNTSKHINKTVVKENEKTSLFTLPPQNDKQNIQSFNRTIDSSIEATVTAENNDSEFKNSLKEETKLLNMSININDPKTTQKFKSNTSLESTLFLPRENSSNIETVPRESNNLTTFLEYTNWLLNSSVYSKETLVEENAKAQVSLFTITPKSDKQDDQPNKNTTNSNTDAKLNTEDKDSDYLITLAEESSKNISAFEDIEYDSDIQPLLPSEFFIKNFDYLITLEDETKTMNSTLNENYTNTLENVKQVNTSQFTIIPPNIDSNYTTNQEDELIKNIVTPNEDATDYDGGDR